MLVSPIKNKSEDEKRAVHNNSHTRMGPTIDISSVEEFQAAGPLIEMGRTMCFALVNGSELATRSN
ncbi:hypothetical protein GBA52_012740 [Prunus armeniaca]|nr:hypothetical protein GBA52_012740 [Prunus armeniaca]